MSFCRFQLKKPLFGALLSQTVFSKWLFMNIICANLAHPLNLEHKKTPSHG
jgi:hypothetical protein